MLEKGDIVICVGFKNLPIQKMGQELVNIMEYYGLGESARMIVRDNWGPISSGNDDILLEPVDGYGKFIISSNFLKKVSDIRNQSIEDILT